MEQNMSLARPDDIGARKWHVILVRYACILFDIWETRIQLNITLIMTFYLINKHKQAAKRKNMNIIHNWLDVLFIET